VSNHTLNNEKHSSTKTKATKKKKNRKNGTTSANVNDEIDQLVASIEATAM